MKPWLLTRELLEDMSLAKTKKEGALVPRWYSWCYYDWDRDAHIYYPIGLTLLVQLYRNLRIFFKFWLPEQFGRRSYETYLYKTGYQDGLKDKHQWEEKGWTPGEV